MNIGPDTYVPSLRWRQGEYQSLFRLSDAAKAKVVPFITLPPIEFDFEEWKPKKTAQEHVEPFAKRFNDKWKLRPAWIDVDPTLQTAVMDSGLDVVSHIFSELRQFKASAVPVVSLDHAPVVVAAIAAVLAKDKKGVAIRARVEHMMRPDFAKDIAALLALMKVADQEADLIVDLGTPAYEPYGNFSSALVAALTKVPQINAFRSLVLMGTAFPNSMKEVDVPGGTLERHDWLFYKHFIASLPSSARRPAFGDYTTVHPGFVALDMRMIKPAGKIVYTSKNVWMVRKGGAFRDNPGQMHDHCDYIVKSGAFCGATYSVGDDYIARCALKQVGTSNLSKWKEVGISHHIMHALRDLSSLGAPP
jgi:hypothetical protein